MKRLSVTVVIILSVAVTAAAEPYGLSGLSISCGYILGLVNLFPAAQFNWAAPPTVSFGLTAGVIPLEGETSGPTLPVVGINFRYYPLGHAGFRLQPTLNLGFDYVIPFLPFVYFGGGLDIDVPRAPVTFFFDAGASAMLAWQLGGKVETGVRFDVW